MRKYLLVVALFAILPCLALAQGTTVSQSIVITNSLGRPLGGVKVEICTTASASSPACAGAASIYSDSALTVPVACSSSACLTSDSLGQVPTFFALPGTYCYTVSAAYVTDTKCHLIVLFAATGGTAVVTNPLGPQSIVGDFGLVLGGSLTSKRFGGVRQIDTANSAGWAGSDVGAWINAAIADVGASRGEIKVACGSYTVSTQISLSALVYFYIHAAEPGCALLTDSITGTPANSVFLINNSDQIRISGFNVSGGASTGHAITVEATDGTAGHGGIYLDHNRFGDSTGNGKDHAGSSTLACGVYAWNVNAVHSEDNLYFGSQHGICLDNSGAPPTNTNIFISQNDRIASSISDGITQNATAFQTRFINDQCEANGGWCGNFNGMYGGYWQGGYMESNVSGGLTFGQSQNFGIRDVYCSVATTNGPCVKGTSTNKSSGMEISTLDCNVASAGGTWTDCVNVDWVDSSIHNVTSIVQQAGATNTNLVNLTTGSSRNILFAIGKSPSTVGTTTNLLNDSVNSVLLTGATQFPYISGTNWNVGSPDAGLQTTCTNCNVNVRANGTGWAEFNFGSGTGGAKFYNGVSTPVIIIDAAGDLTANAQLKSATYATAVNCSSSASPAVCTSAPAGSAVIAAAATTVTVNTSAVTANSEILISRDDSLGTRLSVTCNTQSSLVLGAPRVTGRSAGVSFVVTIDAGPTTNPMCFSYSVVN